MNSPALDWSDVELLARSLEQPGVGPGGVSEEQWRTIDDALDALVAAEDWRGVIRLRSIFTGLIARDTVGVMPTFKRLSKEAMQAAEWLGDKRELAHLLGAEGHNLHRQGYHSEAIEVFERSARLYEETGEQFESLKSHYMTALCHRALGRREVANAVLEEVLGQVETDNPWRGNPLQVRAWLAQDNGQFDYAEALLKEALQLQRQGRESDILVAGTLTDLGEVLGLQGRVLEAHEAFDQSLAILKTHEGQYNRQEARTKLKLAELLMREKDYSTALALLNAADDKVRGYGHYYDLLWRIEMLRAVIFVRTRQWIKAIGKVRSMMNYRHELGLSTYLLLRQLIDRTRKRTGLPR